MAPEKDPQLARLNAQLRDRGTEPERDLWPGIDAAINAEEKRFLKGSSKPLAGFWKPQVLWVAAAVVAFAIITIPFGFQPSENGQVAEIDPKGFQNEVALVDSESTLAAALTDLEQAARENPGDQNLSRLVRMVNSRQGDLLRNKWTANTRIQEMINGGVS